MLYDVPTGTEAGSAKALSLTLRRCWCSLGLALWLLVLGSRPQVASAEGAEVLWLARTYVGTRTTLWVQIHPTGHAWLQLKARGETGALLEVHAALEAAVLLRADDYTQLRRAFEDIGVKPGFQVFNLGTTFGIGPVPGDPTHELSPQVSAALADDLEALLTSRAGDYRTIWETLMRDRRAVGFGCVAAPEISFGATLRREGGGGLAVAEHSGADCLWSSELKQSLQAGWLGPVAEVFFYAELGGLAAADVRLSFDKRVPLLVNDRPLNTASELHDVPSVNANFTSKEGVWRSYVTHCRPASEPAQVLASVMIEPGITLHMPRGLWSDPIEIALVQVRDGRRLVDSRVKTRGEQVVVCQGIADCPKLSVAEIRGLAMSAYGQCLEIRADQEPAPEVKDSMLIQVQVGRDRCTVRHTHACLPMRENDARGRRDALHSLFGRLSNGGQPFASSLFVPCDSWRRAASASKTMRRPR